MDEVCLFGTWKKAENNVKFDSKLEISKKRNLLFICSLSSWPTPFLHTKLRLGI